MPTDDDLVVDMWNQIQSRLSGDKMPGLQTTAELVIMDSGAASATGNLEGTQVQPSND